MNTAFDMTLANNSLMYEIDDHEIDLVSGGFPPVAVAAAAVALGGAALDMGYKLGGMLYKALH